MNSVKKIVPWKCHICQREFDTPRGGICSRCNKATCRKHLKQIGKKLELETRWVCDNCISNDDKSENK